MLLQVPHRESFREPERFHVVDAAAVEKALLDLPLEGRRLLPVAREGANDVDVVQKEQGAPSGSCPEGAPAGCSASAPDRRSRSRCRRNRRTFCRNSRPFFLPLFIGRLQPNVVAQETDRLQPEPLRGRARRVGLEVRPRLDGFSPCDTRPPGGGEGEPRPAGRADDSCSSNPSGQQEERAGDREEDWAPAGDRQSRHELRPFDRVAAGRHREWPRRRAAPERPPPGGRPGGWSGSSSIPAARKARSGRGPRPRSAASPGSSRVSGGVRDGRPGVPSRPTRSRPGRRPELAGPSGPRRLPPPPASS